MYPSFTTPARRATPAQLATEAPAAASLPNTYTSMRAVAVVISALVLSACNKPAPEAPPPVMQPAPPMTAPVAASPTDTSVPDTASVVTPGGAPKADAVAGRSNTTMSRAQESNQMPMPGQNNDHSAPLTPAKRASAP